MLKIAVCDDDKHIIEVLSGYICSYRINRHKERDIVYTPYQSPLELIRAIERGLRYDVIFLDAIIPDDGGINTADEIRGHDKGVKIIFLTSSAEYAAQSYPVNAYYYQIKPVAKDVFYHLMDRIYSDVMRDGNDSIILKCKTGISRVKLNQIEYCQVVDRSLNFHLTDGNVLECAGQLSDVEGELSRQGMFIKPHRAYLVNMDHIQSISNKKIIMSSSAEIPVPHRKYNDVKKQFFEHCFSSI